MSFKVILISPPLFDFYFTPARREPLGLIYVKSSLEQVGVEVELYDATYANRKKRIKTPDCFDYLRNIYREDTSYFSLFQDYFRFGDSFDKIATRVAGGDFDLVGISSNFSAYHPDVEDLIRKIKEETDTAVAVGGWAVFSEGEKLLATTSADYLITGGGGAFVELVLSLRSGRKPRDIAGLLTRESTRNVTNHEWGEDDLFMHSFPERDAFYSYRGMKMARMILTRGCTFRCAFCSVHGRYRFIARSLESIAGEIDYLYNRGVRIIDFEDDNLFYEKDFSLRLLELLGEYGARGMSYAAMNGITAINLLPVVDKAVNAGFIEFNLSLVAGNPAVSRSVNRPSFYPAIEEIAGRCLGRVPVIAFIIAGLPGSTVPDVISDIVSLAKLPLRIGFSPLYMLPDVPMFMEMGLPDDRRLMRGSALFRFGEHFEREDIVSLWKYVRMINRIKAFSSVLSDEDEENLYYFRRSLNEGVWYYRRRDGGWHRGITFHVNLPGEISIADFTGGVNRWQFN
jgi:radical SAM superfamily enzyme YgiQ (UPF0313 family)